MLVGATLTDVRETMIEGESGILSCIPPWVDYDYKPSRFRIRFRRGGIIRGFSADKPDRLRGPNVSGAWGDEFSSWYKPEAFSNLRFCLRKGNPRCLLTSTPKRVRSVKALFKRAKEFPDQVRIVQASTWENAANLSEEYHEMVSELVGTRLGRQELDGELLDDVEGALWHQGLIDRGQRDTAPALKRTIIILDPAISDNKDSDGNGINVQGLGAADGDVYVLGNYSVKGGPTAWLAQLRQAIKDHNPQLIVVEKNRGGNMLKHTIRNAGIRVPVKEIYSTRTKSLRAEPVIPLYEKARVHHVGTSFERAKNGLLELEELMTTWVPTDDDSPDPIDALVIGIHELLPHLNAGKGIPKRPDGW